MTGSRSKLMCIATEKLKFLDILNYLAPGFNYAKFLKAYGATEEKGFFPYEYMDSLERLKETQLPPQEAFSSSLTGESLSQENYDHCQRVWEEQGMETLEDFLVYYNNKDVTPFLEALQTMTAFYQKEMHVDMFKQAISLPGLTLRILFDSVQDTDAFFQLFGQKDEDMCRLVKDQIVGGPSIIFHRYHEAGITKLREWDYGTDAKTCQSILGLDDNALYLWSLMQDMPTGNYVRRKAENQFKHETSSIRIHSPAMAGMGCP